MFIYIYIYIYIFVVFVSKEPPLWLWFDSKWQGWVISPEIGKVTDKNIVAWCPPTKDEADEPPWPRAMHVPYWAKMANPMVGFIFLFVFYEGVFRVSRL